MPNTSRNNITLLFGNLGGNLGDQLIIRATAGLIRRSRPNAKIDLVCLDSRSSEFGVDSANRLGIEVIDGGPLPKFSILNKIGHLMPPVGKRIVLPVCLMREIRKNLASPVGAALRESDLAIGLGGALWANLSRVMECTSLLNACKEIGLNTVVFPHSIPHHCSGVVNRGIRCGLDGIDGVYVRDPISLQNANRLGFSRAKIVPDSVFGCTRAELGFGGRRLGSGIRIGLAIRSGTDRTNSDFVVQNIGATVRGLKRKGFEVVLFTSYGDNDRELLGLVEENIEGVEVRIPRNVPDLLSILESLRLVITDRLHVLILAMIGGIPAVPVLTVEKLQGFSYLAQMPVSTFRWDEQLAEIAGLAIVQEDAIQRRFAEFSVKAFNELGALGAQLFGKPFHP